MAKAWMIDGVVHDVVRGDPVALLHPDIAVYYDTDVADTVQPGAKLIDGEWVNPAVEVPMPDTPVVPPVKVSPVEFRLLFTAQERVAINAARATDPVIDDTYSIIEDPRLTHVDLGLQSTRDAIDYLIAKGLVDPARRDAILLGALQ